jgi:hypothetical protein
LRGGFPAKLLKARPEVFGMTYQCCCDYTPQ